jgi:hypothetical protein
VGGDRVHAHRLGTAAELLEAEVLERVRLDGVEALERIRRHEKLALEVAGRPLDARRGIHHVPVEDDRAPALSHLPGDDRPRVERRAQPGGHAEVAVEIRGGPRERLLDLEETGK